jgi:hypothetical protein
METKIEETKVAILDRIIKAVTDESKPLSADTLMTMAHIVKAFEEVDIAKKEPNYGEILSSYLDKVIKPPYAVNLPDKGEI